MNEPNTGITPITPEIKARREALAAYRKAQRLGLMADGYTPPWRDPNTAIPPCQIRLLVLEETL